MKTKHLLSFLCFLFFSFGTQAQEHVNLNLQSKDTATLHIIRVYPDEFPKISVIFNAETNKGQPIWNLSKKQVQILEDNHSCAIHCLKRISDNQSVNIGLVVDHSSSMEVDNVQYFDSKGNFLGTVGASGQIIPPKGYVSPIESAKKAVKDFVAVMNSDKDSIQVVGFSTKVDKVWGYSNNKELLNKQIAAMQPDGATAFYDAIKVALEQIQTQGGIKCIVALSDGGDNSSKTTVDQVIALAKSLKVPVYTVALGTADQGVLSKISQETGGKYYYTKSSKALSVVYDNIAKKILSIYELGYTSENLSATEKKDFKLVFDIDSIYLTNNDISIHLPAKVVQHLQEKEAAAERQTQLYMGMGIAAVLLVGGLVFLFAKRKEDNTEDLEKISENTNPILDQITQIYPNPFEHELTIQYKVFGTNPLLVIRSINGAIVYTQAIDANNESMLLQNINLEKGTYIMNIQTQEGGSPAQKIVRI